MTGSGMTYDYDIGGLDALYHSDTLGSASWKKERFGKPFASERADEARSGILNNTNNTVQHLQYLPYGEPYINQHPYGYSERFTFTGKERDEETGYGYFGARHMDHELTTMWLSVDPMADKYPSISPYAYCAWNPVKLVDPNGMEVLTNSDGWLINHENKTITHISDKGGNLTQYQTSTDGFTISYDMNVDDFIKSCQSDGYKIKESSSSKTGLGLAGVAAGLSVFQSKLVGPAAEAFQERQQLSFDMNWELDYSKEINVVDRIGKYTNRCGAFLNITGILFSAYQLKNDDNVEDAIFHSMDIFMAGFGDIPHPVAKAISFGWALCGRRVLKAQAEVLMDMGLNPGDISFAPFK